MSQIDVIDHLVGIAPGSAMDTLRGWRVQTRDNAQLSYLALFQPAEPGTFSLQERHAVAYFVAALHRQPDIAAFYAAGAPELLPSIDADVASGTASGPYGHYPAGPLSVEDVAGPVFLADAAFGPRLSAALTHAHMLVFHPRDATANAIRRLEKAGWSATDIVTLSQLVSFLSFQIRVIVGLRALAESHPAVPEAI